jgi:hypothetical protein
MFPNALASEMIGMLGFVSPISQAVGSVSTGWVSAATFVRYLAIIETGVLGASATVDAKIEQATGGAGAGAKDVTGKAITQIVKASGDNKAAMINVFPDELDVNNGYRFIRLTLTIGTAASLVGARLLGIVPKNAPASDSNDASVVGIIN